MAGTLNGISIVGTGAQKTASARLISRFVGIVGIDNVLSVMRAECLPPDGATWPASVGANGTKLGTLAAAPTLTNGKLASVFTKTTSQSSAYSMPTGSVKCVIAVAQYTPAVPFADNIGLIGGQSVRLVGVSGASAFVASGTTYRDGAVSSAVDNQPHLWLVSSSTADTNPYGIGGAYNSVSYTWGGPVWFAASLSIEPSSDQRDAIRRELKLYYPFLP